MELWETAGLTWSQAEMCFLAAAMVQGKPSGMVMEGKWVSDFELMRTFDVETGE